jgi:archaellum component FlaC
MQLIVTVSEATNKRLDEGLGAMNKRLDVVDEGLGAVNRRLDEGLGAVNKRLDVVDEGLGAVNKRLNDGLDDLRSDIRAGFKHLYDLIRVVKQ